MEFDDDQLDYSDLDDRRPGQSSGASGGINPDPFGSSGQQAASTGKSGGGLLGSLGTAFVLGQMRSAGKKKAAQQAQQQAQQRAQASLQQRGIPTQGMRAGTQGTGGGGGRYGQQTIEPLPPEPPQKQGPGLFVRILLIAGAIMPMLSVS
jgi:hypothetical protein